MEMRCVESSLATGAAERLGFKFEALVAQAVIYKQRNRDTAWYSIIDREWPLLRPAFLQWLSPENFDSQGAQKERLSELMIDGFEGMNSEGSVTIEMRATGAEWA